MASFRWVIFSALLVGTGPAFASAPPDECLAEVKGISYFQFDTVGRPWIAACERAEKAKVTKEFTACVAARAQVSTNAEALREFCLDAAKGAFSRPFLDCVSDTYAKKGKPVSHAAFHACFDNAAIGVVKMGADEVYRQNQLRLQLEVCEEKDPDEFMRAAGKYTEWGKLSHEKRTELKQLREATFSFDFPGSSCTGTYVSNEGHILTVAHCFRECIWNAAKNEKGLDSSSFMSKLQMKAGGEIQIYDYDPAVFQGLTCKAKINGTEETVSLVGTGAGLLYPFYESQLSPKGGPKASPKVIAEWRRLVSEGYGAGGDFGIMKVEKKHTPCVKLGDAGPAPKEHVRALSHTCIEGYAHNRDGKRGFYTEGWEETAGYKVLRQDLSNSGQFFHSTLYGETCSSGSSVVGADGSVKGVMVQVLSGDDITLPNQFQAHFPTAIEAGYMKKVLKEKWGMGELDCAD